MPPRGSQHAQMRGFRLIDDEAEGSQDGGVSHGGSSGEDRNASDLIDDGEEIIHGAQPHPYFELRQEGSSGRSGSPAPRARSPRRELLADLEDDVDMAQDDGATQPPLLAGFLKDGMRGMDDGPGGLGFPACLDILAPAALCPADDVQRIVEELREDEISALYDRYSE